MPHAVNSNGSARTARHTTIKLWLNRLLQQIPNVVTELEKPVWMDGINLGTKPRPAGAIADIRVTITTQVSNHKFVTNLLQDIPNALHRGLLLTLEQLSTRLKRASQTLQETWTRTQGDWHWDHPSLPLPPNDLSCLGTEQMHHGTSCLSKLTWSLQNFSVQQDAQNGLNIQPSPSTTYLLSAVNLHSQQPNLALPSLGPNLASPSQGPPSTSPSSSPPSGPPQVPRSGAISKFFKSSTYAQPPGK
ncbi:hypothetical protein BLNAU_23502 [Blattamonas nauphoetae]|uniref:Uncharacterized protein n=1 Tax=Blattamonas nauphoetae TaxID=2049346 RepID=A0ABQ9WR65_9EUKA|nr:hypothetical protein BLNAU_23502 [Blattamonas nauphoetae]